MFFSKEVMGEEDRKKWVSVLYVDLFQVNKVEKIMNYNMSSHFRGGLHLCRHSLWTLTMNSSKLSPPKPRSKQKLES